MSHGRKKKRRSWAIEPFLTYLPVKYQTEDGIPKHKYADKHQQNSLINSLKLGKIFWVQNLFMGQIERNG